MTLARVCASRFLPETLEAAQAEIVLVGLAFLVAEMGQLHWFEHAVHDHRRAEAGAETEKQHAAALVAADGLHRGVVDQFHRDAEGFVEVETDPAATEIVRLAQRTAVDDRSGIAERNAVVVPAFGVSS